MTVDTIFICGRISTIPTQSIQGKFIMKQAKTLTLTGVAEYLGIPKRTFYEMLMDGRFDVDPIKGIYPRRWNVEDVDKWRGK